MARRDHLQGESETPMERSTSHFEQKEKKMKTYQLNGWARMFDDVVSRSTEANLDQEKSHPKRCENEIRGGTTHLLGTK